MRLRSRAGVDGTYHPSFELVRISNFSRAIFHIHGTGARQGEPPGDARRVLAGVALPLSGHRNRRIEMPTLQRLAPPPVRQVSLPSRMREGLGWAAPAWGIFILAPLRREPSGPVARRSMEAAWTSTHPPATGPLHDLKRQTPPLRRGFFFAWAESGMRFRAGAGLAAPAGRGIPTSQAGRGGAGTTRTVAASFPDCRRLVP